MIVSSRTRWTAIATNLTLNRIEPQSKQQFGLGLLPPMPCKKRHEPTICSPVVILVVFLVLLIYAMWAAMLVAARRWIRRAVFEGMWTDEIPDLDWAELAFL